MIPNKRAEKILYEYPKLKIEVKNLYIDLEEIKEIIVFYGEDGELRIGSSTYKFNSIVEKEVMSRDGTLQDKVDCIKRIIKSKECRIQQIENAINLLDEESIKFIKLRYWNRVKMEHIAAQYHLSKTALYKRKDKILKELSLYLY